MPAAGVQASDGQSTAAADGLTERGWDGLFDIGSHRQTPGGLRFS
jgi:hypothetical protein